MATHCSILAWRIPRTEGPGGPWSMGSQSPTQLKQLSTRAGVHTCLGEIFQGPRTVLIYMWGLHPLLEVQKKHTGVSVPHPCVCILSVLRMKVKITILYLKGKENHKNDS